jgi:Ca-activated chloride channel family protein
VDLRIAESPVELVAAQPARLPDLFYGEELVVFGRYREGGSGRLVVAGTRNGARERVETQATFATSESGNGFIPRLWAARRIGELTRIIRVEGPTPVLIEEMRDLALRFGILTEYTSYLVQEPDRVANAPAPMPRLEEAREQTGAGAFERARRSAKFLETKTLQSADEVAAGVVSGMGPTVGRQASKVVGGRIFVLRDSVWTDVGKTDRISITAVAAFSPAYFALVRMLPELTPYLSAGEDVLVAGRRGSIRVAHQGIESWKPGELAALVRNFRGT